MSSTRVQTTSATSTAKAAGAGAAPTPGRAASGDDDNASDDDDDGDAPDPAAGAAGTSVKVNRLAGQEEVGLFDHNSLTLDHDMLEELMLINGVVATAATVKDEAGNLRETVLPVDNHVMWLNDCLRALKNDNEDTRPVAVQLGAWSFPQRKLAPLLLEYGSDHETVRAVLRILMHLTNPMTKKARQAALVNIDVVSVNSNAETVRDQRALKDNALKQARLLLDLKAMFLTEGLLGVLVDCIKGPIERKGANRTTQDHNLITSCVYVFKNLLCAESLVTCKCFG